MLKCKHAIAISVKKNVDRIVVETLVYQPIQGCHRILTHMYIAIDIYMYTQAQIVYEESVVAHNFAAKHNILYRGLPSKETQIP